MLQHKGYFGSVEVSIEDGMLHGKLQFVNDLVTYEANSVAEIKQAFTEAVDDYLETCALLKKQPDQAFSGAFNVRVGPDLHKRAAISAAKNGVKLNALVVTALEHYLEAPSMVHTHNHTHEINVNVTMSQAKTAVGVAHGFHPVETPSHAIH